MARPLELWRLTQAAIAFRGSILRRGDAVTLTQINSAQAFALRREGPNVLHCGAERAMKIPARTAQFDAGQESDGKAG